MRGLAIPGMIGPILRQRVLVAMTPSLAREPRSRDQIAAATRIIRDVLGNAALAAYLYGSAVAGGLRANSDLDILTVSNRTLTNDERAAIIERLLPISGLHAMRGPARSIELSIITQPVLAELVYPPSIELQYGEWKRAEFGRTRIPTSCYSSKPRAAPPCRSWARPLRLSLNPCHTGISFGQCLILFRFLCQASRKGTIDGMGCSRWRESG
jgi:hypothetical protein